jgi:hypothetical protein
MANEKKTFPLGKGTGNTLANAKAGPSRGQGTAPGHGFNNSGGDGKALSGGSKSKPSVPTRVGYKNSNGTGKALAGKESSTPPKSHKPGEGYAQDKGTGVTAQGTKGIHKGQPKEDTHKMGTGTGTALRGKDGGHKKGQHGTIPQLAGKGKGVSGGKSTTSKEAAPYGLHDASKGMQGLRHYKADSSPLGIKTSDDVVAYRKKKYGV